MRVLLLEDSPLDVDLLTDWLDGEKFECRVNCVNKREEFVAELQKGDFDVILSDYSLPGFDGTAALELARELRPETPFLFVSGYLGEDLVIETLKRGATDYVLKGHLERLVPSIHRALREAKEREERQRIETTLHLLSNTSLTLSSLDYDTTFSRVASLAVPHFCDCCVVDVIALDGSIERVAVDHADSEKQEVAQELLQYPPVLNSQHPLWKALSGGQSRLVTKSDNAEIEAVTQNERHREVLRQIGYRSAMFVPLVAEGQALGVMTFISTSERDFSPLDLSLAEDLAMRCALAIENASLHRKALEALKARDEFLAVLSHELRSPLTSILGWIDLMRGGGLDEKMWTHGLQVIERNTKVQVQLIQDLLEVSRIISGKLRLDMAQVFLDEIVRNVLTSMAPTWQAKGIDVRFENKARSTRSLGDPARLQQIVSNLLSNAIKFTPEHGRVDVVLDEANNLLRLSVTDSGEGIAPEFLPYVFDRFRQADSGNTRQHGGLGLGLAIVRLLTEMHGGMVQACSEGLGKGSIFMVTLTPSASYPISSENDDARSEELTSRQEENPDRYTLEGIKVLLVEDGDDARELLATVLRRDGAQVTAVASVAAAMDSFRSNIPDILVSDIAMPDEDGYSLIGRIKAWEAEHDRRIPSIALTAFASESDRTRALKAGFQEHLAKPVEPATLTAAVMAAVQKVTSPAV